MPNPFLVRAEKGKKTSEAYKRSPKQEKAVAKRYGGLQTPASGRGRKKGDVAVTNVVRIECKATQAKSFSITAEMLQKITEACLAAGELPVIIVEFLDATGKPVEEVAVMPTWALNALIADAKSANNQ